MIDNQEVRKIEARLADEIDGFGSLWPSMRKEIAWWVLRDRAEQYEVVKGTRSRCLSPWRGHEKKLG